MRWILIFWALPITILGTWYGLSYNDINFGYLILSRQMNEFVFQLYGQILGIPAEDIPGLVLRAIVVDTVLLFGVIAFRRRRQIADWWRRRQVSDEASLARDDSLSSAP
ncbi:MAG: hypothetical protein KDJ87_02225 [Rhizobiaceae bacterium]|nr:hypothetical protein [Rhizobiaceae bacterium]